jgi:hypothetical protein
MKTNHTDHVKNEPKVPQRNYNNTIHQTKPKGGGGTTTNNLGSREFFLIYKLNKKFHI